MENNKCDSATILPCSPDANVERNRQLLLDRSIVGFKKYGVTTERDDLSLPEWVQHALEEVLDLANYLQAIKTNLEKEELKNSKLEQRIAELEAREQSAIDWCKGQPPKDGNAYLLKFKSGVICSGRYRDGNLGEPQQHETAWRCDCCGRFATPEYWAHKG